MRSYVVEKAGSNVVVLGSTYNNTGYNVFCYDDNECKFVEFFLDKDCAEAYGQKYLESDWIVRGCPISAYYDAMMSA
jgi:hypothetical protein